MEAAEDAVMSCWDANLLFRVIPADWHRNNKAKRRPLTSEVEDLLLGGGFPQVMFVQLVVQLVVLWCFHTSAAAVVSQQ